MAEQTQNAAPPAADKEKTAPKPKVQSVKTYKALRALKDDEKCPPQAKVVLGVIAAAGKDGITREALVKKLEAPGLLTTKQTVEKILGFYQPKLVKSELVSVTTTEVPVPAEAAKAPETNGAAPAAGKEKATAPAVKK